MRLSSRASAALPAMIFALLTSSLPAAMAQSDQVGQREAIQSRITELEGQVVASNGEADELRGELAALRSRLTDGDFRPGDAIALQVRADVELTDTFMVSAPRQLKLPGLQPIDLTGLLRDELEPHLQVEIARYVRDPVVTAQPLWRLGVLGAVERPGYYFFRPDTPVLDVFGIAGGVSPAADINKTELQRLGQPVVKSAVFRQAMADGWELAQLDVRPGDEVYVPAKGPPLGARNWVYVITGLIGATLGIIAISNAISE